MSPVLSSADLRVGAAPVLSVNRGSAPIWTPGGPGGLPEIGDPFEGGFFAGLISHTADGNPTHALIVAPAATGATGTGYPVTTNLFAKTTRTETINAESQFDGFANTQAHIADDIEAHPATKFCVELSIGGFSDWYLPAVLELEIAYHHLKPTTGLSRSTGDPSSSGINPYAVPPRGNYYEPAEPGQTSVPIFQDGEAERFTPTQLHHTSSTRLDVTDRQRTYRFSDGLIDSGFKNTGRAVRAFRRISV